MISWTIFDYLIGNLIYFTLNPMPPSFTLFFSHVTHILTPAWGLFCFVWFTTILGFFTFHFFWPLDGPLLHSLVATLSLCVLRFLTYTDVIWEPTHALYMCFPYHTIPPRRSFPFLPFPSIPSLLITHLFLPFFSLTLLPSLFSLTPAILVVFPLAWLRHPTTPVIQLKLSKL